MSVKRCAIHRSVQSQSQRPTADARSVYGPELETQCFSRLGCRPGQKQKRIGWRFPKFILFSLQDCREGRGWAGRLHVAAAWSSPNDGRELGTWIAMAVSDLDDASPPFARGTKRSVQITQRRLDIPIRRVPDSYRYALFILTLRCTSHLSLLS